MDSGERQKYPMAFTRMRGKIEEVAKFPLFFWSYMGKKALARLQPTAIARVPTLKCRCRPHRNCLASLDLDEVRKCRQDYWRNLASEHARMSWLERSRLQARVSRSLLSLSEIERSNFVLEHQWQDYLYRGMAQAIRHLLWQVRKSASSARA